MGVGHSTNVGIARFQLLRPLGSGGTATVFEALDRVSQERVAIKVLRQSEGASLYRFKQEFRVLCELSHPNVVRYGELFEDQGAFFLTMELIEGEDFLQWVRPGHVRAVRPTATRTLEDASGVTLNWGSGSLALAREPRAGSGGGRSCGRLDEQRLRSALEQLCSGLVALHSVGLIHRDLKPENIIVVRDGRLVLLDFGLTIELHHATRPEWVGTALYMAPELHRGQPLTAAADWYAVGAILYEALTGESVSMPSPISGVYAVAEPVPAVALLDEVEAPADLCALCRALLHTDPTQRPSDVEMARELGLDIEVERGRASFRSRLQYVRDLFSGRQDEIAKLSAVAHAANHRDGVTICHVTGESGVGKSALIRQLLSELTHAEPDTEVLAGRCYERERVPYAGVDRVIDDLANLLRNRWRRGDSRVYVPRRAALLGQVFPVLRGVEPFNRAAGMLSQLDPFEARRLAFGALRELLAALSDDCRLLMHIDDVQWLDSESATLLQTLIAGPEPPRMLLILTERSADGAPRQGIRDVLAAAASVTHTHLLPLTPLESERLARQLMERLGGCVSEPALIALHSGGHPLFIHELVMHGVASKSPWAPSLESALSARVAALAESARRLLEIIALAEAALTHQVAQQAAKLQGEAYSLALFTLRAENLVAFVSLSRDAEVRPYHDRIRELVVMELPADRRAVLHGRLAAALESYAPDALDAVAHHYFHAGRPRLAVRFALQAAQRALGTLAFASAVRSFQLALEAEHDGERRSQLEEGLASALANAGRGVEAGQAFLRASACSPGDKALELKRCAGEQLLRSGRVEHGLAVLSEVADAVDLRMPVRRMEYKWSVVRAYARTELIGLAPARRDETGREQLILRLCWTLASSLSLLDVHMSTHFLARAAELALLSSDRERALRSVATLGAALSQVHVLRPLGMRLLTRARELAGPVPSDEDRAWLDLDLGIAALGNGELAECELSCSRALATFRDHCTGVSWEVVNAQAFTLWAKVYQGKIPELAASYHELLADERARGDRFAFSTLALGPLHLVSLARNRPEEARQLCAEAVSDWTAEPCVFQRICALFVETQIHLYEQQPERAWSRLMRGWPELESSMFLLMRMHRADFLGLRARVALSCAANDATRRKQWARRASRDAERLANEPLRYAQGLSATVRAGLATLHQQLRAASDCLRQAQEAYERSGMRLHAALTRRALAVSLHDLAARERSDHELANLSVVHAPSMHRLLLPAVQFD